MFYIRRNDLEKRVPRHLANRYSNDIQSNKMTKLLSFLIVFFILGCQNSNEKKDNKIPLNDKSVLATDKTKAEPNNLSNELVGDSMLCSIYARMAPLNKIVFDTLDHNPLKNSRIVSILKFERTIEECINKQVHVYSRKLKLENGIVIEFMEDNSNSKNAFLTVVNDKLFSIKKLLGEMFVKESVVYFHYDSGKIYKLSDGNILFVEQPASWSGRANNFDCYQYFDLKKKEIIQFIEKDEFIRTLQ
jgi:hypothetical protein